MQPEEFKAIDTKFKLGLEKLERLQKCLQYLAQDEKVDLPMEPLDRKSGELIFWYAGTRYYIKIRITDRDVDDLEPGYRVPIGWLDWGRFSQGLVHEPAEQSNFYDERGILCDVDKEEFYCTFSDCGDERVKNGLMNKLHRLTAKTIAINNAEG